MGIFDQGYHFEILTSQCFLFKNLKEYISVRFFVDQFTYEQMCFFHADFDWVVFDKPSSVDSQKVSECDILLLDVTEKDLDNYVHLNTKAKVIFRIHNLNFWLNFKKSLSLFFSSNQARKLVTTASIRDLLVILKTFLPTSLRLGGYAVRNKVLNLIDYLTFCDQTQFDYYDNLKQEFKTIQFPSSYYVGDLSAKGDHNGALRIVVAGEVSQKRRDYHIIAEAIAKVKSKQLKIDLIILGNGGTPNAKQIIESIQYCTSNCRLLTFNSFIDQEKYISIINKSHILLNPIPEETLYCGIIEKYGFSKTSGAYGDFLRYGLIPVFPSFYPFPTDLVSVSEHYNNIDQLVNIIERFTNTQELNDRLSEIERDLLKLNQESVNILTDSLKKLTTSI